MIIFRQLVLAALFLGLCVVTLVGCASAQRGCLFFPTHHARPNGLDVWDVDGRSMGTCRQVAEPENVWLMLHGNAGQAADRAYAIPSFSPRDSVFILEYPGYGGREGKPSRASFNVAAIEAYTALRRIFPSTPICIMGESIGSGPACVLAGQAPAPDKIVLVVPFDKLTRVASEKVPFLPMGLLLEAKWNNIRALEDYRGSIEIFAAENDRVIPIEHARQLAESIPSARFHSISGGHNDWSKNGRVTIRNP